MDNSKNLTVDELLDFVVNNEEDSVVDFTGVKLYKLTSNDGKVFMRISYEGKSIILCKNDMFICVVINDKNFNGNDSTYSYIKKSCRSVNCTDILLQKIKERMLSEGKQVSVCKIIEHYGLGKCKVYSHGNRIFVVKTADKTQLCGYVSDKLLTITVPEEYSVMQAN